MQTLKKYWAFLLLFIIPVIFQDNYFTSVMVTAVIFAILALSLNIVVGYIGEISFGHAGFFGLGAYTTSLLTLKLGTSFWVGLLGIIIVLGIVGAIIALLALRLKGPYFAIVTLAFAEVMRITILNWDSLTRGAAGLNGIPNPKIFGLSLNSEMSYYALAVIVLLVTFYIIDRLLKSKTGIAFIAIREKEELATSVGINSYYYKVLAFSFSAIIAGISGGLYAHYFQTVTPDNLGIHYTTLPLIMVMVGGRGTLWGPIIGAFIFTLMPEYLRDIGDWRMVIFAVILGLTSIFLPKGITSLGHKFSLRKSV